MKIPIRITKKISIKINKDGSTTETIEEITPEGDAPEGDAPGGDTPGGDASEGNIPGGNIPGGNIPESNISKNPKEIAQNKDK